MKKSLKRKFIALSAYINNEMNFKHNLIMHSKGLEKQEQTKLKQ